MGLTYSAFGGGMTGKVTAAANTVFTQLIPSYVNSAGAYVGYTRLAQLNYTNGNTANNIYLMRPIGRTTTSAASNSAINTVTLTADPGTAISNNIAANDYVAVKQSDGTWLTSLVSAFNSTSKVLTLVSNTTASVASGAKVVFFGIKTDTDPLTGSAHPIIATVANTTATPFTAAVSGFVGASVGDPLLVFNDNATNASQFNWMEYGITRE